jgi:hypothetical protein
MFAEQDKEQGPSKTQSQHAGGIGKSPGEVAFFKLLHTEFKKVTLFFERSLEEYAIREERVREGMKIMKQPNSIMVNEKWSLMAKSIHRLYKDLLLLETFAIMTYCSFSKILKKHDKVTRYETRSAFMENVVNKANFTHYPQLMEMISRCEGMHEEVSEFLLREGKECLYEDERLFINMINRLNEQVLTSEDSSALRKESSPRRLSLTSMIKKEGSSATASATSTLRTLLEDTEKAAKSVQVHFQEEASDDGSTQNVAKRPASPASSDETSSPAAKRQAL